MMKPWNCTFSILTLWGMILSIIIFSTTSDARPQNSEAPFQTYSSLSSLSNYGNVGSGLRIDPIPAIITQSPSSAAAEAARMNETMEQWACLPPGTKRRPASILPPTPIEFANIAPPAAPWGQEGLADPTELGAGYGDFGAVETPVVAPGNWSLLGGSAASSSRAKRHIILPIPPDWSLLHYAVSRCKLDEVKCLVERGAELDAKDARGYTPVFLAASPATRCAPAISYLLDHGAKLTGRVIRNRDTILHIAASTGSIRILAILLDRGASLEAKNRNQETPLGVALTAYEGSDPVVKYLVARGADVRTKKPNGNTLLHTAVLKKVGLPLVEFLVQSGADVAARNRDKLTASELSPPASAVVVSPDATPSSSESESWRLVHEYLLRVEKNPSGFTTTTGAPPPADSSPSPVPLEYKYMGLLEAVESGNVEAVRYRVVTAGDKISVDAAANKNPFNSAIEVGNVPILKILLEGAGGGGGGDGNNNNASRTAGVIQIACEEGQLPIVKYLVEEAGAADINAPNKDHLTPLHACIHSAEALRLLVAKRGVNLSAEDSHGGSALHLAAQGSSLEPVCILVEAGANVSAKNHLRQTPLMRTAFSNHPPSAVTIAHYLIEQGGGAAAAALNARDVNGHSFLAHVVLRSIHYENKNPVELLKYLVGRGADLKTRDHKGKSLLHLAAEWRSLEVYKFLVEESGGGLDVNGKDEGGNTPLHDVASAGSVNSYGKTEDVIRYLVERRGADLRAENLEGKKPVDLYYGWDEDVKALLVPK